MGTGGRPYGGLAGFTEDGNLALVLLAIELRGGNAEDGVVLFIFFANTGQQVLERDGSHYIAHDDLLAANLLLS
ncbi:hypothetical protein D3C80_1597100 [compost metagenome]